jgi:phosphatidylglycerol---prolipoprotein diacylglyceryl transferase
MTSQVWVHDLDPFLFKISGNFGIRWYSLAYLTGFALAFLFMSWFAKTKRTPLTLEQVSDFLTYLIVGVLLGGRLGYVLFYSPELLTDFRHGFPYWGALAVWEGGMASHGGFIGVILACILFAWRKKIDPLHLGDITMFGATSGIFLGRIANFINGELMGRVAPATLPWAVKFPQDIYRWIGFEPNHLPQLAKTASLMGVSESDWMSWVQNHSQGRMYDLADKIIAAVQNGNMEVTNTLAEVLQPRHPSQLYASLAEGLVPMIILGLVWLKPRKSGVICSLYLIVYSLSRIIDEMFRLPDGQLSDLSQLPLGLSRGQFLSLFMFIGGVGLMTWSLLRQSPKWGGILAGPPPPPEDEKAARKNRKK